MVTYSSNQFSITAVEIATLTDFKGVYLQIVMFYLPYSSLFNLLTAVFARRYNRSTPTDAAYRPVCAIEVAVSSG